MQTSLAALLAAIPFAASVAIAAPTPVISCMTITEPGAYVVEQNLRHRGVRWRHHLRL